MRTVLVGELSIAVDGSVPPTLENGVKKFAGRVAEITGKGIMYDGEYDVSYRAGWASDSDPYGAVHSDSSSTARGLLNRIRDARRCDCEDCARAKAAGAKGGHS